MVLLLLVFACRGPAPPPARPAVRCAAQGPFLDAPVEAAPAAWAARRLAEVDVLALGEFHGLAPQIRLVSDVLLAASEAGLALDLGAELLPASRQAQLDGMTSAARWDEGPWAEVVAGRPLLGPLALADYLGPVEAAWRASRAVPVRVVGLSPPCDFASAGDAEGAVACLDDREAFMADRADDLVLKRGRKLVLSAGFNHTSRVAPPDAQGQGPTALARLAEGRRALSLLLAGPVSQGADGGWRTVCAGLLDAVGAARGGAPFAVDLRVPPWDALDLSCVGHPPGSGPLSEAFDGILWLGDPAASPPPTPLPPAFFEAVGQGALGQWNRFEVELQGAPAGHLAQGADVWAGAAQAEAARYAALPITPPACEAPPLAPGKPLQVE